MWLYTIITIIFMVFSIVSLIRYYTMVNLCKPYNLVISYSPFILKGDPSSSAINCKLDIIN